MAYMLLWLVFLMNVFFLGSGESPEGLILLQLKNELVGADGFLNNWIQSDDNPCLWKGITCDPQSNFVVGIDLSDGNLSGAFPAVVCRLTHLRNLSLAYNNIGGTLSSNLSMCRRLEHLDLSQNLFFGGLPDFISDLPELKYLDLSFNNFSGLILPGFGKLPRLEVLKLCCNFLEGTVPSFLMNMSNLVELTLGNNPFSPWNLTEDIGKLSKLQNLWVRNSHLMGKIPESVGSLLDLTSLDLSQNQLSGAIPDSITQLKNVVEIELFSNNLTGPIPRNMSGLTALRRFDASTNMLEGTIPESLAALPLESLNLFKNHLQGTIPEAIAASPNLYELKLFTNTLSGNLPEKLGQNSPLEILDIANNHLNGSLPSGLCKKGKLRTLNSFNNQFTGQLPEVYGDCLSLIRVRIQNNKLNGEIPSSFWGLPRVSLLDLSNNQFNGTISPEIGNARNLSVINISGNKFSGSLPSQLGKAISLSAIDGGNNQLTGSLPPSLASLFQLGRLDLQGNQISGTFITNVQSWKQLTMLNLSKNKISGPIPAELGQLPVLNKLDLSANAFEGEIPVELGNLKLNMFNLSDNQLTGMVPAAFQNSFYESGLLGNAGLCGNGFKSIKSCSGKEHKREGNSRSTWLFIVIFVLAVFILLLGLACFYRKYHLYGGTMDVEMLQENKSAWNLITFHKLGFRGYEILDCIDEGNVIGSGGSGKVYKATLGSGEIVAIKRLFWSISDPSNDNGFKAEVETLGHIRHKNIVKLWCCLANRDSKLLVYEHMPNGSLWDILHGPKAGLLDWPTRYKIAVGAAQGLAYLHHDCVPPIIHRDVKSNNILLDSEFNARLADFGLAKIIQNHEKGVNSMSAIAGSYGYIAPEYAYTLKVNEKSDIYSFGVVLLELVTGKQPVDPKYEENKDLVKCVRSKVEQHSGWHDVLDPRISEGRMEEMIMVLKVALLCTTALPINRPSMRKVLEMLLESLQQYKLMDFGKDAKFLSSW